MINQTYKQYDASIKKMESEIKQKAGIDKVNYDNVRPLTEFELKRHQRNEKRKMERLKKVSFYMTVPDDSMSTSDTKGHRFPKGTELAVVPPDAEPITTGCYVVASYKGHKKPLFRKVKADDGLLKLVPLNDQYPVIKSDFEIIGKVVDYSVLL